MTSWITVLNEDAKRAFEVGDFESAADMWLSLALLLGENLQDGPGRAVEASRSVPVGSRCVMAARAYNKAKGTAEGFGDSVG